MEMEVKRLREALDLLEPAVPRKPNLKALEYVRLGEGKVLATDLDVAVTISAIGEPGAGAPVIFTTNFSLTYYTVESDVEASRVPCNILVVDTEGTSVLTAYSGDKLNEKTVADAMAKFKVADIVNHRKLIIPGYVAVMSGKLEEATGWEIIVGPRESSMLPKFLREVWKT